MHNLWVLIGPWNTTLLLFSKGSVARSLSGRFQGFLRPGTSHQTDLNDKGRETSSAKEHVEGPHQDPTQGHPEPHGRG